MRFGVDVIQFETYKMYGSKKKMFFEKEVILGGGTALDVEGHVPTGPRDGKLALYISVLYD